MWASRLGRITAFVCALGVIPAPVTGHDLSRSTSTTSVTGASAGVVLEIDLLTLDGVRWSSPTAIAYDELDRQIEIVYGLIKQHFQVGGDSAVRSAALNRYELLEGHVLRAELSFEFDRAPGALVLHSTLHQVTPDGHQHVATVRRDGTEKQAILSAAVPEVSFAPPESWLSAATAAAWSGALSVVNRLETALFLIVLVMAMASRRAIVTVLGWYAIVQLAVVGLAVWNVALFPPLALSVIVPFAIAAMALGNLIGAGLTERVLIASAFAFAQAMTQAQVLAALRLSDARLASSLFAYNVGVELMLAAALLLLSPLARQAVAQWRHTRPAISAAAACLAMYWIVQQGFAS